MNDPKEITIAIGNSFISIDLKMKDEDLIDVFLNGLEEYVNKGSQLKITQTYAGTLSDSTKIIVKLISKSSHINEWKTELKQLLCVMQQDACVQKSILTKFQKPE